MNIDKKFEEIVKGVISKKYGFPNSDICISPFDFIDEDQDKVFSVMLKINVVDVVANPGREMSVSEVRKRYDDDYAVWETIYIVEESLFNSEWLNNAYNELLQNYSHNDIMDVFAQYDIVYIPKNDTNTIDYIEFAKRVKSIYERDDWLNTQLQDEMLWSKKYLVNREVYFSEDTQNYDYIFKLNDWFVKLHMSVYWEDWFTNLVISKVSAKEIVKIEYEDIGEKVVIV